jgi:hypothetical protein
MYSFVGGEKWKWAWNKSIALHVIVVYEDAYYSMAE